MAEKKEKCLWFWCLHEVLLNCRAQNWGPYWDTVPSTRNGKTIHINIYLIKFGGEKDPEDFSEKNSHLP